MAGEMTANSPSPAIVNAIDDGVGVWIPDLPVTPEKVLNRLDGLPDGRRVAG